MSETTKLKLPYIAPAQAQKHVTVNEAFARLDTVVQTAVESRSLTEPPIVVGEGETYLVASGASGAWTGAENQIASFQNGGWVFLAPQIGWQVWVADEALRLSFTGVGWLSNLLAQSPNYAATRARVVEVDYALTGGTFFEDTPPIIPAQTSVWAVTGRVLTPISGSLTDWSLGIDGSPNRYGDLHGLTAGTWLRGVTGQPVTYYEDTSLRLTANGGDFTGGSVRLAVHLVQFDVPEGD